MYQYLKELVSRKTTDDESYVSVMHPYDGRPPAAESSAIAAEEPEESPILPVQRPPPSSNMTLMASRQDAQLQSPIFGKLPLEIRRLIYVEVWRTAGLSQHVFPGNGGLGCTTCLVEDHFSDTLLDGLNALWDSTRPGPDENLYDAEWYGHMVSSSRWSNHWRCWENKQQGNGDRPTPAPFLPMLLSCRTMFLETSQSISESVSFACTDFITARRFLGPTLPLAIFPRKIAVSLQLDPSWIDGSMKRFEDASQPGTFYWNRIPRPTKLWNSTIKLFLASDSRRQISLWLQASPLHFPRGLEAEADCLFSELNSDDAKRLTICLPKHFDEESDPSEENVIQATTVVRWRRFSPYFLLGHSSHIHRIGHRNPPVVRVQ